MNVKIKKLVPEAVIPRYQRNGDAGLDLTAISRKYVPVSEDNNPDYFEYGTGLAIQIPEGHVGLLFPRSSNSNVDMSLTNCVGVIDSNYRGEIKARFKVDLTYGEIYNEENDHIFVDMETHPTLIKIHAVGSRIMQLIILPYPSIELVESEELDESVRNDAGFGSSGK
jgi:dUTP pyrophosphatase